MTFKKYWPADRIDRATAMKAKAQTLGLLLTIKNAGIRNVPMFILRFTNNGTFVASFFDIAEAENWLRKQGGVA